MEDANSPYSQAEAELRSVKEQIALLQEREQKLEQFIGLGKELFDRTRNPFRRRRVLMEMSEPGKGIIATAIEEGRAASMKAQILNLSRNALALTGSMHTRDLVNHIERQGVAITGADKNLTVSVILSRSPDFKADRTIGWTLTEKNPHDVAASTGSSPA